MDIDIDGYNLSRPAGSMLSRHKIPFNDSSIHAPAGTETRSSGKLTSYRLPTGEELQKNEETGEVYLIGGKRNTPLF